jgi:LEA14-like dessication related protein
MKRFLLLSAVVLLFVTCKHTPDTVVPAGPEILEPGFSISSIMILQAELINTRLRVKVRVDNPNPFPLTLSSFQYELYGEGRFWAEGTEKNILEVPADGYAEKDLFLIMNFIDMKRDLLDKVIAMDYVAYRFAGSVTINADEMPALIKEFNLEGESEVDR